MADSSLIHGVWVALFGMGAVFVFLGMLVLAMHAASAALRRWDLRFPEKSHPGGLERLIEDRSEIAAAIAVARAMAGREPPQS